MTYVEENREDFLLESFIGSYKGTGSVSES